MIKFKDILNEGYTTYRIMIRVSHLKDLNSNEMADIVRALKGVTIVRQARTETGIIPKSIFTTKFRTNINVKDTLKNIKSELLAQEGIKNVDIAYKTLEKVE